MPSYKLNHILRPGELQEITPTLLLRFLQPHADVLARRGVVLPAEGASDPIPYRELAAFLGTLEPNEHPELADALYYVNEMCSPNNHDVMVEACARNSVEAAAYDTTADLALRLWLLDPSILERLHAEALVYACQRFDYYRADAPVPGFAMPSQERLDALASDLDLWFDRKKRGRGCRVFCYEQEGMFRFLVLHGEPYARVPIFGEDDGAAVHFRPAKYDVLTYNPLSGELGVNTQLKGLRQEYLYQFGNHLFDDPDQFPPSLKYSLAPLASQGASSLAVGSFCEHLDSVKLVELHVFLGGTQNAYDIHRADDLFLDFASRGRLIPSRGLSKAKLSVKFAGEKRPRLITIEPPRTAKMTRESDALLLEAWLLQRGFITEQNRGVGTKDERSAMEGA